MYFVELILQFVSLSISFFSRDLDLLLCKLSMRFSASFLHIDRGSVGMILMFALSNIFFLVFLIGII